uniref:histidine kinase n=1 Tax=Thermorudis sp. TaxID=1969470 RepID=A0A7C2WRY3_9BACT
MKGLQALGDRKVQKVSSGGDVVLHKLGEACSMLHRGGGMHDHRGFPGQAGVKLVRQPKLRVGKVGGHRPEAFFWVARQTGFRDRDCGPDGCFHETLTGVFVALGADQRHHRDTDRQTGYRTRNMVTVPLKTSEGQPVGVMQVLNKSDGNFDEDDLAVLEILAAQAAFAIELAHLYQQARVAEIANRIGDISHDVKNMITPVVTGAQTLELMLAQMFESLDEVLADDPTGTLAQRVRDACAMVRSFYPEAMLMTYDGIQAAQDRVREIADAIKGVVAEPHFEPTNANDVIDSVIRTLRLVADRQGVTLDSSGLGSLPPAEIDRKHLYNAIYNLINNAIPETPSGGRVYVQTAPEERNGELGIRIVVGDTGRGMPEHVRARLFTPNAISTKPGGTGLGTRIVKNVVDLHHGEISVTSQEGHGTEFTLWLPLRQPQAAARAGG